MNRRQFVKFLNDCNTALINEFEMKYTFVRNIVSSKDEPRYRFSLTIVSKLNNVDYDFSHITLKNDSAIEVVAQVVNYLKSNDELPSRVRDVVNVYLAGFTCAGGEM